LRPLKILVTGGAGFIGSNLVDRLISMGEHVIVLDNFDDYYPPKIKRKNIKHNLNKKNFELIKESIRNSKVLSKILKDVEIVFHLAARPGVRPSIKNPKLYHEVNVDGTLNLLNACLDSNVKKIIYSSSSSVYGEPEYLPIDEKHPTNPISPYGATKLAAEKYSYVFSKIYGLRIIVLRYFTVFGPRQRPDMAIAKFTMSLLQNIRPQIYGDGKQTRDFTYIDNVVDANILAMKSNINWGIFNIGSGQRISINELLKMLNYICGTSVTPIHRMKRKGDITHTWSDIKKTKEILNYEPKVDIKEGIKRYVVWVKKNYIRK